MHLGTAFNRSPLGAFVRSKLGQRYKGELGVSRQMLQQERPWAGLGMFPAYNQDPILAGFITTGKIPAPSLSPGWSPPHSDTFSFPSNDYRDNFRYHWRRRTCVFTYSNTGGASSTYTSHDIIQGDGRVWVCDGMPSNIDVHDGSMSYNGYGTKSSFVAPQIPNGFDYTMVTLDYLTWTGYSYTAAWHDSSSGFDVTWNLTVTLDDYTDPLDFPAELTLCTGLVAGTLPNGHGLTARSFPAFGRVPNAGDLLDDYFQNMGFNTQPRQQPNGTGPGVDFPEEFYPPIAISDYDGAETLTPGWMKSPTLSTPWWGQDAGPYPIGLGSFWYMPVQELSYSRFLNQFTIGFDDAPVIGVRTRFRLNTSTKYFKAHGLIVNNGTQYFTDTATGAPLVPAAYGTMNGSTYNTVEDCTILTTGVIGPGIKEVDFPAEDDFGVTAQSSTRHCGAVTFIVLGETPAQWSARTGLSYS